MAIIRGTSGNDSLAGTSLDDGISGLDGNDALSGGAGNDGLFGGAGNDRLNGGVGVDRMAGATGNDWYWVDVAGDRVTEYAGEGLDRVYSTISYRLGLNVEELTLLGSGVINGIGNGLKNIMRGNGKANRLEGGGGNDIVFGLNGDDTLVGGAGSDRLEGGYGNDTYRVGAGDRVIEVSGQGTDVVQAEISFTLSDNVEHLFLVGAATNGAGNALANRITGNAAANLLSGLGGADTLDGGEGADTMVGGTGDDLYYVDIASDVVTEATNAGIDRIVSSVSWFSLDIGLEHVTLAAGATEAIEANGNIWDNDILGNEADNILRGDWGNDTLTGGLGNDTLDGGSGLDRMVGGVGDDTYYVNAGGDIVEELAGAGIDTVKAAITYTLAANVENLDLEGSGNLEGIGNELNNFINGNEGDNTLRGLVGNDYLFGGAGNDYLEGGSDDDILEGAAGIDRLNGGGGNDLLQGNADRDTLEGVDGDDTLQGGAGDDVIYGGDGNDRLEGGLGQDSFENLGETNNGDDLYVYNSIDESTLSAPDYIASFTAGVGGIDEIDLSGIDANVNLGADQAFGYSGANDLAANSIAFFYDVSNSVTAIVGDVDGDALADFRINLYGNYTSFLQQSDFVL